MHPPIEMASDVVAGGTALAGLILVYLGGVVSGYASFEPQDRQSVKRPYALKGWFAFIGILLAMASAGVALAGRWRADEALVGIAVLLLLVALVWGAVTALLSALEIK